MGIRERTNTIVALLPVDLRSGGLFSLCSPTAAARARTSRARAIARVVRFPLGQETLNPPGRVARDGGEVLALTNYLSNSSLPGSSYSRMARSPAS